MKGYTVILALVLGMQAIHAAEILRGYMVAKDNSMCIHTTSVVADSSGATAGDATSLSSICTLMSVKDGTSAGQYIVEEQADNTKQVTLTAGGATTFTNAGTELTFTPEGTMVALTGITSADVSGLTTSAASVYVASVADQVDNTDCLDLAGNYIQGTDATACANKLWYFVTAACTFANCQTCNPDPAACSACESSAAFNTAQTACVACSDTPNCATCSLNSSDAIICATCGSNKYPTSGGGACEDCDNIIANCTTCSVSGGTTTCTACGSDKTPSGDGLMCETTTTAAATTTVAATTENSAVVEKASCMALIGMASVLLTIF